MGHRLTSRNVRVTGRPFEMYGSPVDLSKRALDQNTILEFCFIAEYNFGRDAYGPRDVIASAWFTVDPLCQSFQRYGSQVVPHVKECQLFASSAHGSPVSLCIYIYIYIYMLG